MQEQSINQSIKTQIKSNKPLKIKIKESITLNKQSSVTIFKCMKEKGGKKNISSTKHIKRGEKQLTNDKTKQNHE